jgi:8-oxo-dGTP pyrophosphatase MutT (NUDIX family)
MNKKTIKGEKHFCSSVWITTNTSPKKILLVNHKKLGKWLQPGGHIEKFENPVQAAIREIKEETGLNIKLLEKSINIIDKEGAFLPLPTFIMEQTIPKNINQPKHFHIDLQYVVKLPQQKLLINKKESQSIGWFTKQEALKLSIHEDTRIVIRKIMPK